MKRLLLASALLLAPAIVSAQTPTQVGPCVCTYALGTGVTCTCPAQPALVAPAPVPPTYTPVPYDPTLYLLQLQQAQQAAQEQQRIWDMQHQQHPQGPLGIPPH